MMNAKLMETFGEYKMVQQRGGDLGLGFVQFVQQCNLSFIKWMQADIEYHDSQKIIFLGTRKA